METIARLLPLRSGADGAVERARRDVVLALPRIAQDDVVCDAGSPVQTQRAEHVIERRRRVRAPDGPRDRVADADQRPAILVPDFQRAKREQSLTLERAAES